MSFFAKHRGEVMTRDPGVVRDRASGTVVTVGTIATDPTANS